jgi:hypothetical protein
MYRPSRGKAAFLADFHRGEPGVLSVALPRPCRNAAPRCGLSRRLRGLELHFIDRVVHFDGRTGNIFCRYGLRFRAPPGGCSQSVGRGRYHAGMDSIFAPSYCSRYPRMHCGLSAVPRRNAGSAPWASGIGGPWHVDDMPTMRWRLAGKPPKRLNTLSTRASRGRMRTGQREDAANTRRRATRMIADRAAVSVDRLIMRDGTLCESTRDL